MSTINFSQKRLKASLRASLLIIATGICLLFVYYLGDRESSIMRTLGYTEIAIGVYYLISHLYNKKKQYLTIENGVLTKNDLFPKRIKLDEILSIKEFAGDIILKKENDELIINTEIIDEQSLAQLRKELNIQA